MLKNIYNVISLGRMTGVWVADTLSQSYLLIISELSLAHQKMPKLKKFENVEKSYSFATNFCADQMGVYV